MLEPSYTKQPLSESFRDSFIVRFFFVAEQISSCRIGRRFPAFITPESSHPFSLFRWDGLRVMLEHIHIHVHDRKIQKYFD